MAVVKMKELHVVAPKKKRKEILERLQSFGIMELTFQDGAEEMKMDTAAQRTVFLRNAQTIEEAICVLDKYAPEESGLFASLEGRDVVDRAEYEKVAERAVSVVEQASRVVRLQQKREDALLAAAKAAADQDALLPWLTVPSRLDGRATKTTEMVFGSVGIKTSLSEVTVALSDRLAEPREVSSDNNHRYLAVLTKKEEKEAVLASLRKVGFVPVGTLFSGMPAEENDRLAKEKERLEAEEKALKEEIRGFSSCRQDFKITADYFATRAEKYEVLGKILQSKSTFFLSGYVPERETEILMRVLSEEYGAAVECVDTDEAPVELQNNRFSESFEGVLESFGLPKKGELDPSVVMSFFYVFLFGIMLSDAAYGAIISIACLILLRVFRNMESSLRKSIKMFMFCGISTFVWGILFGGYFGDAAEVISRTFFGKEVSIPPLWFAPLWSPMRLLLYSMLFGLIHLFTGLGLKGYLYMRDKDVVGFVSDVLSWFMLLAGLLLLLLNSSIYDSLSGAALSLGTVGKRVAISLVIAGALIILVMAGRSSKNVGKRLLKGAYSLYDITSWLSDVLSYSRLLALGLATGVIASVINQMGSMGGKSILGTVVFIIVFIVGHTFNLAINLLGAYVHTNRLQYVEFFGKFYEGGGRKFQPFSEKTKHVKFKNNL